ncbi:MAG: DUF1911 domain-containing protein [bacterium]
MRDNQKTKEYFEEYLAKQETKIATTKPMFDPANPNPMAAHMLFRAQFNKLMGLFSIGGSKEELVVALNDVLTTCECKDDMEYDDLVSLLSLAYLLDVNPEKGLKETIYFKIDTFLCMLTDALNITPDCEIETANYDPYDFLFNNINKNSTKEEVEAALLEYLEDEWYDLSEDWYWFETLDNSNNVYFGYWSFEAMAIAKMFDIDLTKLIESDFFSKI